MRESVGKRKGKGSGRQLNKKGGKKVRQSVAVKVEEAV